jgi:DNA-binding NtrC family response regulator
LQLEGVDVLTTDDAETVLGLVKHRRPRIILLGLTHSAVEGDGLLGRILERDPGAEIIVMSEADTAEAAVEALKQGASDYLCKPVALETLRERVEKLVAEFRRRQRALRLDVELLHEFSFEGMVGRSAVMLEVFNQLSRIAPHFQTVLVSGPTGTGKELVARALHGRSPAAPGPFVSCNCSAIVETLFESELFGHVKGAFTGATQDKIGLIEYANGGTLFMDEVGDLPMTMQAKLLRVMQNWEVQRVGSPVTRKVNIRLVAATNRDLRQMVAQKHFRDDLYHRLSMLEVRLPSLTERKEDLPLLIRHFIERFAKEHNKQVVGLARRAQVLLGRYSWPGNVRELENVLRHAFLMAPGDVIHVDDLPDRMREPVTTETGEEERAQTLDEVERAHARRVMELVHGNKLKAAKVLGVSRATLYRLLGEAKTEPKTQKS